MMRHVPTVVAGLPGFESLASTMMKKEMEKLDIPPVSEMLEMIVAGGGQLHGCQLAVDMFKLKRDDFVDDLEDIITVGDMFGLADGEDSHIIFV
jgi:peroxiredoxin family protein